VTGQPNGRRRGGEIEAFLDHADVTGWTGLPPVGLADLGADPADVRIELLRRGDPPAGARVAEVRPGCFVEGVRCWLDAGQGVELLEGLLPGDAVGAPVPAPDLGAPALRLPTVFDALVFEGGELVYPDRGLAVRINPDNGVLLGLLGFAPTTPADYRTRLRPVLERQRPTTPRRTP
jgi:hypothetical protein